MLTDNRISKIAFKTEAGCYPSFVLIYSLTSVNERLLLFQLAAEGVSQYRNVFASFFFFVQLVCSLLFLLNVNVGSSKAEYPTK